ncbi:hypothetical protein K438DRAFT_1961107 [Mycena galopus ATCC 62051]|nr:hypothetical protein K438DRAFT_1961107 [Mycena galopus ATCC 62051]
MKRGFLNSSKAKARPLGPTGSSGSNAVAVVKPDISSLEEKSSHIRKNTAVDVPAIGPINVQERKSIPDTMTFTTLPVGANDDEPVTECFFFAGSKELVLNTPGFPQPLVHPATPAFRIETIPGKGVGAFSTRALKMGELVLSERPLFVSARTAPTVILPDHTPEMVLQNTRDQLEKYCALAVDRMRPENKAAFMALANSHTEDGSGPCVGIMRTNSLGLSGIVPSTTKLTEGADVYSATCRDISRLNHSCSPNTSSHFDLASFSYSLYAVRDIAAEEELTYSYVDIELPSAERNEKLKPYGFICTCVACTDPTSDARRASLEGSAPNVFLWSTINRNLSEDWIFTKALQQLALLTTEGMEEHVRYSDAITAMMEAYICLGDADNASKWAAKVHKQAWAGKYKPADVEALLDPANTAAYKTHPYWRKRVDPLDAMSQMLQAFGALSGPNNTKTLAGGYTMMMFNPLANMGFPQFN